MSSHGFDGEVDYDPTILRPPSPTSSTRHMRHPLQIVDGDLPAELVWSPALRTLIDSTPSESKERIILLYIVSKMFMDDYEKSKRAQSLELAISYGTEGAEEPPNYAISAGVLYELCSALEVKYLLTKSHNDRTTYIRAVQHLDAWVRATCFDGLKKAQPWTSYVLGYEKFRQWEEDSTQSTLEESIALLTEHVEETEYMVAHGAEVLCFIYRKLWQEIKKREDLKSALSILSLAMAKQKGDRGSSNSLFTRQYMSFVFDAVTAPLLEAKDSAGLDDVMSLFCEALAKYPVESSNFKILSQFLIRDKMANFFRPKELPRVHTESKSTESIEVEGGDRSISDMDDEIRRWYKSTSVAGRATTKASASLKISASKSVYKTLPLQHDLKDIRLLSIEQGDWGADIKCSMFVTSIEDEPDYEV